MCTVPAHSLLAPTRAKLIAARRSMPGVCATLGSSWSPGTTRTPSCFHFVSSSAGIAVLHRESTEFHCALADGRRRPPCDSGGDGLELVRRAQVDDPPARVVLRDVVAGLELVARRDEDRRILVEEV